MTHSLTASMARHWRAASEANLSSWNSQRAPQYCQSPPPAPIPSIPLVSDANRCFTEFSLEPVPVSCVGTLQVPSFSEMKLNVKTPVLVGGTWMLERITIKPSVVVARAVVGQSDPEGVCVQVISHTLDIATVYNGTKIAALGPIEDVMTVALVQQLEPH